MGVGAGQTRAATEAARQSGGMVGFKSIFIPAL